VDKRGSVIPSYDDLTPGIPDVLSSESVSQLALFLHEDLKRKASEGQAAALYACLRRSPNHPITKSPDLLLAIARDFSPRVMVVSDVEVLLDVSGLGRLIGEPPAVAAELGRALQKAGMGEVRVAIAPTQTAARLMARQLPLDCARGRPDYPITQLPNIFVTALQSLETLPPGMNHRDRARPYETRDAKRLYEILARWGIVTLGDLVALPAAALSSRLGRRGVALQRLARGLDPTPFVPDGETPRYIGRLELEWPIEALEPLSFVFARLLDPLSTALERADRGAVAVRLDLRLTDRQVHARVLPLPAPMRDPRVLRTLLLLDLESHPPSAAVDVVSIELDPAPARITQFSLLARARPSPETLSTLTARLSALVGASRVGSAALLDTHQPGAFEMTRYAPERGVNQGAKGANGAEGANGAGATSADGAKGAVLRRQRTPPAIRVSVEQGRPAYLAAARRGMPQGAVTKAAGPWRTSGGWWGGPDACRAEGRGSGHGAQSDACRAGGRGPGHRAEAALGSPKRSEGGWNRDEWDVALTSGAVCRIFQDRTTERWFLEGTYD
jgi:protein ImuB